jgi:uncharacterized membrane protein
MTNRIYLTDSLRGLTIIWMIIFHFTYDLSMFKLVNVDFNHGFWYYFPRIIAFTFLFCVGISLELAHAASLNKQKFWKRFTKISVAALLISVLTYFIYPEEWIYFGTLHCIAVGSLISIPFLHRFWLQLITLITILFLQWGLGFDVAFISKILKQKSMDFIPIYPWFEAILIGMLVTPFILKNKEKLNQYRLVFLENLGKKSLIIYIVHQPVLYLIAYLLSTVL